MNTLRALRDDLKAALTLAGITVLDHLPERLVPPLTIIAAGSPYIESGDAFGSYRAHFTLVLVGPHGTNETTTHALDELIAKTLVSLDAADWGLERVDPPMMLQHGGGNYLSTQIDVVQTVGGIDDGGEG